MCTGLTEGWRATQSTPNWTSSMSAEQWKGNKEPREAKVLVSGLQKRKHKGRDNKMGRWELKELWEFKELLLRGSPFVNWQD